MVGRVSGASFLSETFIWNGLAVRHGRVGHGPPVVLCHGTPWSSFVWRTVVDALAPSWTVHVWDMLGYGQSAKPNADVSLETQGQLLAALIDHWGIGRPHVVAHDFGGAVALRSHLLHQVPVESLTLVDIVILRPWGSPFFRLVGDNPDVFAALPPNLHRVLVREYISGASSPGLAEDVLDQLVEPWLGPDGQAAFYRQIAQADERFTAELEPLLSTISVPTSIIWGADDTWIPPDRAHRLGAMISDSTVTIIEGAGHLIQEDAPTALIKTIQKSLPQ